MQQIITTHWLRDVLDGYWTKQQVVFSPIRHSEYTVEFHRISGKWVYEDNEILHYLAMPITDIPEYDQIGRGMCNGYEQDAEDPTWLFTAIVYMREDGILVIMM